MLGQSARCVAAGAELDAYQVARLVTMYATGKRCRPIQLGWERGRHWLLLDRRLEELLEPTRSAVAALD